MSFLKLIQLGFERKRSVEHYRKMQEYLAQRTVVDLQARGIDLSTKQTLELAAAMGGYSVVLSKYSKNFVASDLERSPYFPLDDCEFIEFDAERPFPIPDDSFDFIYCSSLVEHLKHPQNMIEECYRVLRKNGVLFLSYPPFYSIFLVGGHQFKPFHFFGEKVAVRMHNALKPGKITSYETCFGAYGLSPLLIDDVTSMLTQAGFQISHKYTRSFPINTTNLPWLFKDFLTWHACFIACKQS